MYDRLLEVASGRTGVVTTPHMRLGGEGRDPTYKMPIGRRMTTQKDKLGEFRKGKVRLISFKKQKNIGPKRQFRGKEFTPRHLSHTARGGSLLKKDPQARKVGGGFSRRKGMRLNLLT